MYIYVINYEFLPTSRNLVRDYQVGAYNNCCMRENLRHIKMRLTFSVLDALECPTSAVGVAFMEMLPYIILYYCLDWLLDSSYYECTFPFQI